MGYDELDALIAERAIENPEIYALIDTERARRAAAHEAWRQGAVRRTRRQRTNTRANGNAHRLSPHSKQNTYRAVSRMAQQKD